MAYGECSKASMVTWESDTAGQRVEIVCGPGRRLAEPTEDRAAGWCKVSRQTGTREIRLVEVMNVTAPKVSTVLLYCWLVATQLKLFLLGLSRQA